MATAVMALEAALQNRILGLVNQHWASHATDAGFGELIESKEPGHHIADFVDDRTCALLKVHLDTRYEGDRKGGALKRSMGDIWVRSEGIFNPVNVKSGLQGRKGQPNVVSMRKLLNYLFRHWIDSYYLLMVKFSVAEGISHQAYLFDLLDWLDFVNYDAGPGQIMLREQEFYDAFDAGHLPPSRSIQQKAAALFRLFEEQVQVLIDNRRERLRGQKELLDAFLSAAFAVDQADMSFAL